MAKENRDIATIMAARDMAVKLSTEIRISKRPDRKMNMHWEQFLILFFSPKREASLGREQKWGGDP